MNISQFQSYKIFIDSSSILESSFEQFSLSLTNNALIVTYAVLNEAAQSHVFKAQILKNLENQQLIIYRGIQGANKEDELKMVFSKFKDKYDLLFITQDSNLANNIAQISPKIAVQKISHGNLVDINATQQNITQIPNEIIKTSYIPAENDFIWTQNLAANQNKNIFQKLFQSGGGASIN